jgi:TfoX/Sxy family transcriptional regulator of competence genes
MTKDAEILERAHALFDPVAARYLERPDVDIGAMFGSQGLRVRGKVFAFVGHLGGLVVKLPEARVTELAEQGAAERMVMRERPMREWTTVDVEAGAQRWDDLIGEAFAYLDEITP